MTEPQESALEQSEWGEQRASKSCRNKEVKTSYVKNYGQKKILIAVMLWRDVGDLVTLLFIDLFTLSGHYLF